MATLFKSSLDFRVSPSSAGVRGMDPRINLAVEIMAEELDHPLLVNTIASRLGLSPWHFEHLFKAEIGRPFKATLKDARLAKARELLLDPTRRIKEVALAVGFNFLPNFTREFTRRYGQPPSQHRFTSG
jgi:transcriptional regulator GlxA family with amidase domain